MAIDLRTDGRSRAKLAESPFRDNVILLGIISAFLLSMSVMVFSTSYNFDIWYMMATGRAILESGIT